MTGRNRINIANQKAKKAFKKYYPQYFMHGTHFANPVNDHLSDSERKIWFNRAMGRFRKTRVFCSSSFCCGNPRHYKGVESLTPQERRSLDNFKQQLIDIN